MKKKKILSANNNQVHLYLLFWGYDFSYRFIYLESAHTTIIFIYGYARVQQTTPTNTTSTYTTVCLNLKFEEALRV